MIFQKMLRSLVDSCVYAARRFFLRLILFCCILILASCFYVKDNIYRPYEYVCDDTRNTLNFGQYHQVFQPGGYVDKERIRRNKAKFIAPAFGSFFSTKAILRRKTGMIGKHKVPYVQVKVRTAFLFARQKIAETSILYEIKNK